MRINFNLPYTEIKRLIEPAPANKDQAVRSTDFNQLLSELGANDRAGVVKPNGSGMLGGLSGFAQGGIGPLNAEPDGAFSYVTPQIDLGFGPERVMPNRSGGPTGGVNGSSPSVPETPKVLSINRSPSGSEMAALPRAERVEVAREMVLAAGRKHGIDPALGLAVAAAESNFNPLAISQDGFESKGLFQLLDTTGSELHEQAGYKMKYNPFSPELNVDLGMGYLRRLHELFSVSSELGSGASTTAAANSSNLEKLAVAAFNAGEGRVASAQSRAAKLGGDPTRYADVEPYLPEITKQYVTRVMQFREQFEGKFQG